MFHYVYDSTALPTNIKQGFQIGKKKESAKNTDSSRNTDSSTLTQIRYIK